MKESSIQRAFVEHLSSWFYEMGINGAVVKFEGAKGWPDLVIPFGDLENHHTIWVEFKRPGEKPRPMQVHIHKMLRAMGADVRVYDNWHVAMGEVTQAILAKTGAGKGR